MKEFAKTENLQSYRFTPSFIQHALNSDTSKKNIHRMTTNPFMNTRIHHYQKQTKKTIVASDFNGLLVSFWWFWMLEQMNARSVFRWIFTSLVFLSSLKLMMANAVNAVLQTTKSVSMLIARLNTIWLNRIGPSYISMELFSLFKRIETQHIHNIWIDILLISSSGECLHLLNHSALQFMNFPYGHVISHWTAELNENEMNTKRNRKTKRRENKKKRKKFCIYMFFILWFYCTMSMFVFIVA